MSAFVLNLVESIFVIVLANCWLYFVFAAKNILKR